MNQKIISIVNHIPDLPNKDRESILELLEHDEWGVALESLCGAIYEEQLQVTQEIFEAIKSAGEEMKMDSATWEDLKSLIA